MHMPLLAADLAFSPSSFLDLGTSLSTRMRSLEVAGRFPVHRWCLGVVPAARGRGAWTRGRLGDV
ncbi:MAG: hypothetical protein KatS3mg059_1369 [Thermomicrobiales bacterium]|nr:MAG: hypothetical protein KatS3mg059_1369 [Thermomicrobiales bacterium]